MPPKKVKTKSKSTKAQQSGSKGPVSGSKGPASGTLLPRPPPKSKVKQSTKARPKTKPKTKPKSKSKSTKSTASTASAKKKKGKDVTRYYKLPCENMKTKEDVVRAFGYTIEKQLDKGGFGTIFIASDNRKGVKVAVKWMDLGIADNDPRMLDTRNELTILEQVRHPYVIRLHCHFIVQIDGKNNMYIFMELADGGNLYKYIQKTGVPDEALGKKYFAQILCGINHMHGYNIAHRDVKLQNVLLVANERSISGDYLLRVTDFGLSTTVKKDPATGAVVMNKTVCGTPLFMAPELYEKKKYDAFQVDVWALGVTLYLLMTLETPFDFKQPPGELLAAMKGKKYDWPVEKMKEGAVSAELTDITAAMMAPDPAVRKRLIQLINHQWVAADYAAAHDLSDTLKAEELAGVSSKSKG